MTPTDEPIAHVSRSALLEAADALASTGTVAPGGTVDEVTASIVGAPRAHLTVTLARRGDVRRSEVWMAETGVVALAHQEDDEVPGPYVALPPYDAHQVCVSALGLDPGSARGAGDRPVPEGFSALVGLVVDGGLDGTVAVVDCLQGDATSRWVILDTEDGRVADLAAPVDPREATTLRPVSPLALARALSGLVAHATRGPVDR